MSVAAGINQDSVTLYQAVKVMVIVAMLWAMWNVAARSDAEVLMRTLYAVLAIVVLTFFLVKFFSSDSYRLGQNREGDIFARAGVIWKAGVFFLPLFLADSLLQPQRWVAAGCAIGACIFLTLIDGSRTGLLLIAAIFIGMAAVLLWRRDWRLARRKPWTFPLAAAALLALLLLNSGATALKHGVSGSMAPMVATRLGEGDAPRLLQLHHGIEKSFECFPLGCGFGSTSIDSGYGIPMYVHNAYLTALADFGLFGLIGLLGFAVAAIIPSRVLLDRTADPRRAYFIAAVSGSAFAYCVSLNLHTFSTEMSEWGYLLFMLAFAWQPARESA